jgi:hypothetical protein
VALIGSRIRVWWTEEKAWYAGRVLSVGRGASGSLHTIAYDDGAQATHYLQSTDSALNEIWEPEPSPSADGADRATPPKRARPSRLLGAVRNNEPARLAQLLERERAAGVSWPAQLLHAAVGQPASLALLLGSVAAAELPAQLEAQLEACDSAGHTPLSLACAMQPCNPEVAEALLRAGADAARPVRAGASTPLYEACVWPPRCAPPPPPPPPPPHPPAPCHAPVIQHVPPSCPASPPHDGSVRWACAAGHSWCRCCCGTATPTAAPSREAGRR